MKNINIGEAIKNAKKLHQKKYRTLTNQFLVEGYHLVEEAYQLGLIEMIFTTQKVDFKDALVYKISDKDLADLSNVKTPQSIIAVCNKPKKAELGNHILLLDGIQDPGNLGTILRTAVAFGFNTVIAENTCDFYNDKVIRSSQGAIFKINIIIGSLINIINDNPNYKIYSTDVLKGKKLTQIDFPKDNIMLISES